ncbi:MAG: hypothetical protein AAF629_13065, partial [Chloroflexota bacterium]
IQNTVTITTYKFLDYHDRYFFAPDGATVLHKGYQDRVIQQRDIHTGQLRHRLKLPRKLESNIVFMSDGGSFLVSIENGRIYHYRLSDGTILHTWYAPYPQWFENPHTLRLTSDQATLIAATFEQVRIWDLANALSTP